MASTNSIESVWAVLKKEFYGTYHSFSKKHIDRIDTIDGMKSLVSNMIGKTITYKELVNCI